MKRQAPFVNGDSARELIVQDEIKKMRGGLMIKHQKVERKEYYEWSSLAEPDKYLTRKHIKGIDKKYMEALKQIEALEDME